MNKIAIIGTNGIPAKYGGFETLAFNIALSLSETNEVYVYCSKKNDYKQPKYKNVNLIHINFNANGWQSFFYDFVSIIHSYLNFSHLIILGFSGAFAFPLNYFFKKKIIFNMGGIEWKKVRGKKLLSFFEIKLKKSKQQNKKKRVRKNLWNIFV